jgi:uncharacterized membrane protein (UPF0127 family)
MPALRAFFMALVYAGSLINPGDFMPLHIFSAAGRLRATACAVFLAACTLAVAAQDVAQMDLQRSTLSAGMHQIEVQLATTPAQRQTGLMFRKEMPQGEGMLFIFEEPAQQCFWMKNTLLPLTAAFVADDGTIVNLADMKPQTTDSHCSQKPVRYVLEMNVGWFAKKGIKAGSRLRGPVFQASR